VSGAGDIGVRLSTANGGSVDGARLLAHSETETTGTPDSGALSQRDGRETPMEIDVSFDQNIDTLPSGFVAAIDYVVGYFDSLFTNPVTINIHVGYGEIDGSPLGRNDLGESFAPRPVTEDYGSVVSVLRAQGAPGSARLPPASPLSGNLDLSRADAEALGFVSTVSTSYVGFSDTAHFSYAVNSTSASEYYFIGVVEHEFTEDMGRVSAINAQPHRYDLMDMFRYSSPGVHDTSAGGRGSTAYFSLNGGYTDLGSWNNNPRNGDLGDWYGNNIPNGGDDAFNDYSRKGVVNAFSAVDLTLMEAIGWTTAAETKQVHRPCHDAVDEHTANVALLGQYAASRFAQASAIQGGAPIVDSAAAHEAFLAHPRA
jgi:hypothetical protein